MNKDTKNKILNLEPFYIENFTSVFFSWKDLENLLNLRPFVNGARFTIIRPEKKYSWPNCFWLSDVNSFPPNIIKECIQNNACYFKDCSRVNEHINSLCGNLEVLTKKPVDAHIYFDLTGQKNKSFPAHWDFAHNLIVQMEGQTNFKIWNFFTDNEEKRSKEEMKEKPFIDVVLKPGDAVFVPAKMWHKADSITKRISISFPIWYQSQNILNIQEREWINLTNGV